ncbi:MAG: hypothetical protein GEV10_00185 [Streptosporangiales bacterium]|nr:hypothetical protein [Streptosporangiales bacterium]
MTAVLLAAGCSNPGGGGGSGTEEMPKSIKLVVPYTQGGGTDTWARVLAPELKRNLEGQPTVQIENLPGGEGIAANNRFYDVDPPDGSRLLVGTGTSYIPPLLGVSEAKCDFSKLTPLITNGTGSVLYATKDSGVKKAEDLAKPATQLKYGGISATGSDLGALIAFDLLKLDVKTTFGFEGRGPIGLALQRGELNIDRQTTSAFNAEVKPQVESGDVTPLMTYGVLDDDGAIVRDPNFKDLPTVPEVYKTLYGKEPSGPAYAAYRTFAVGMYSFEKAVWAKPGTPKAVIDAFNATVPKLRSDKRFTELRTKALGNYQLSSGAESQKQIDEVFDVKPETRTYILDLLKDKYDTTVE